MDILLTEQTIRDYGQETYVQTMKMVFQISRMVLPGSKIPSACSLGASPILAMVDKPPALLRKPSRMSRSR